MTCGIYKIENLINHKIYIGQSIEIEQRLQKHKTLNDNLAVHQAIQKYGKENFSYEIIEVCSKKLLNEREKYWIKYYDCCLLDGKDKGYNMDRGGSNGSGLAKGKPIERYTLEGVYLDTYPSANQAAITLNINVSNIVSCANDKRQQAGPFQWKWADSKKEIFPMKGKEYDHILQYDLQGHFIKEFNSLDDVINEFHCDKSSICIACKKNNLSSQGFQWKYKYSNKQIGLLKSKIIQYDKNGNLLNEYNTLTEASKQTGINRSNISECCSGKRKSAGGFIWKKQD